MAKPKPLLRRMRKAYREFKEFWAEFMLFCYTTVLEAVYKYTLPFTTRAFSR